MSVLRALEPERERELIRAAQAGDAAAFDRLVEQYQHYIYRLMVRACHHPDDAEEVAAEAFLRAYERLAQFEGRASFVTWLGRIAANLCFRRREKPELASISLEQQAEQEAGHPGHHPAAVGPTPEQRALREEMKRKIEAAVAELPEPDRTVLRLRDIEQFSSAETAEQTGLSVAAVKARLHRARARLRQNLNAYFLGENQESGT